jgi:hypothetical protein
MRWHETAPKPLPRTATRRPLEGALAATAWFEPSQRDLKALTSLLDSSPPIVHKDSNGFPRMRAGLAATLLRRAVFLAPPSLRPYFAVCALEGWRRVSVQQLAVWSGIPLSLLKRSLGATSLTPAGVASWNLALHATWLLDVVELPSATVVLNMRLGRPASLAAVLGARGVRFCAGRVEPGAFAATLDRYLAVLRAAFRV